MNQTKCCAKDCNNNVDFVIDGILYLCEQHYNFLTDPKTYVSTIVYSGLEIKSDENITLVGNNKNYLHYS